MGFSIKQNTCFLPEVSNLSTQLIELYQHYKNGYLPYFGGIQNQKYFLTQAFLYIEGAINSSGK